MPERISEPTIELLAIQLYEEVLCLTGQTRYSWMELSAETRELYRAMARGEADLPSPPNKEMGQ